MGTSTISIIIKPPFLLFPLDFEVASRWLSCVSTVSQESQPDRNQIPRRSIYVCTIHFLMPICVCVIWSKNFHYASLLEQRNQLPPRFRVSVSLGVLSHKSTHIRNKPGVAVQQLTYFKKNGFKSWKNFPYYATMLEVRHEICEVAIVNCVPSSPWKMQQNWMVIWKG